MKKIAVLGSTGSVGKQTLEVVKAYPKEFRVVVLACQKNWPQLLTQIKEFKPEAVAVFDKASGLQLKKHLKMPLFLFKTLKSTARVISL